VGQAYLVVVDVDGVALATSCSLLSQFGVHHGFGLVGVAEASDLDDLVALDVEELGGHHHLLLGFGLLGGSFALHHDVEVVGLATDGWPIGGAESVGALKSCSQLTAGGALSFVDFELGGPGGTVDGDDGTGRTVASSALSDVGQEVPVEHGFAHVLELGLGQFGLSAESPYFSLVEHGGFLVGGLDGGEYLMDARLVGGLQHLASLPVVYLVDAQRSVVVVVPTSLLANAVGHEKCWVALLIFQHPINALVGRLTLRSSVVGGVLEHTLGQGVVGGGVFVDGRRFEVLHGAVESSLGCRLGSLLLHVAQLVQVLLCRRVQFGRHHLLGMERACLRLGDFVDFEAVGHGGVHDGLGRGYLLESVHGEVI
jgi:hypothetical protein